MSFILYGPGPHGVVTFINPACRVVHSCNIGEKDWATLGGLLATLSDPCLFPGGIYKFYLYRIVFFPLDEGVERYHKEFLGMSIANL